MCSKGFKEIGREVWFGEGYRERTGSHWARFRERIVGYYLWKSKIRREGSMAREEASCWGKEQH